MGKLAVRKSTDVSPALVAALRVELIGQGCARGIFSDHQLRRILVEMPDADLAATACTMKPRPRWVQEILGS